ncbi:hypothetical protein PIB30_095232 [Stylosanthes scabra]|uniref:Uncharacterized protein n=1 Tax=Stylosanthes scabra TaxID=79078 RepID=A0ABU6TW98_9FABA|nr:hypothetical protein [Stylosanthes scabra]
MSSNSRTSCWGLRPGSTTMKTELTTSRRGFAAGFFGSSAKPRSIRAQASSELTRVGHPWVVDWVDRLTMWFGWAIDLFNQVNRD